MTPAKLLEQLEVTVGVNGSPKNFTLILASVLENIFFLSAAAAAERADDLASRVATKLIEKEQRLQQQGVPSTITFVGMQKRYGLRVLLHVPSRHIRNTTN